MIRRLFWMLLGLVLGVWTLRRLEELTEASRPGTMAERTGRRVGGTQARWRDAVASGRDVARARETELRSRYGVPTLLDLASLEGDTGDAGDAGAPDAAAPHDPTTES